MLTQEDAVSIGAHFQEAHQRAIDSWVRFINDAVGIDEKMAQANFARDGMDQLEQGHWAAIVAASDGELSTPSDLSPLNPAHALVLAVRHDIVDTRGLFESLVASGRLGQQIAELKKVTPLTAILAELPKAPSLNLQAGVNAVGEAADKFLKGAGKTLAIIGAVLGIALGAGLFLRARGK